MLVKGDTCTVVEVSLWSLRVRGISFRLQWLGPIVALPNSGAPFTTSIKTTPLLDRCSHFLRLAMVAISRNMSIAYATP